MRSSDFIDRAPQGGNEVGPTRGELSPLPGGARPVATGLRSSRRPSGSECIDHEIQRTAVIRPARIAPGAERVAAVPAQGDDTHGADELARVAGAICSVSGADRAVILTYDSSAEALHGLAGHGVDARAVESARFQMHESPLALRAAVSGLPAYAGEVSDRSDAAVPLLGFRPLACLPLLVRGRLVGVAYLDRAGGDTAAEEGRARLQEVALLAALALEAVQRSPVSVPDDRFARALHDGVLQTLCAIGLEAGRSLDGRIDPGPVDARLEHVLSLARMGTEELREALAVLGGAAPARLGLGLALGRLVTDIGARADLAIDVEIDDRLRHRDDAVADALYRTCREGLANVVRHARASQCHIRCGIERGWASARVEDDGVGSSGVAGPLNFGLMYLRGVLAGLGGDVEIRPREPVGTILLGRAPLDGGGADRPTG
ncbi:MAG TPA: histidine kinase [Vicinamibacterales bacterium]|nr:histidine kinase [Vicinamibacterales bacterium]